MFVKISRWMGASLQCKGLRIYKLKNEVRAIVNERVSR